MIHFVYKAVCQISLQLRSTRALACTSSVELTVIVYYVFLKFTRVLIVVHCGGDVLFSEGFGDFALYLDSFNLLFLLIRLVFSPLLQDFLSLSGLLIWSGIRRDCSFAHYRLKDHISAAFCPLISVHSFWVP